MKGIATIHEDTSYSSIRVSSVFKLWFLNNGKYSPNYGSSLHRDNNFLTFGEAEDFFYQNGVDEEYILISEEEFRNEVKRRKEIVKGFEYSSVLFRHQILKYQIGLSQ